MNFSPVRTVDDLESLDQTEMLEGYSAGHAGDPEPGGNRGRSFWHGWRNGMVDAGHLKGNEHQAALAAEFLNKQRVRMG